MDSFLELIIFLVIAASSVLFSGGKKKKRQPPPEQSESRTDPTLEDIREEIRRRIEGRSDEEQGTEAPGEVQRPAVQTLERPVQREVRQTPSRRWDQAERTPGRPQPVQSAGDDYDTYQKKIADLRKKAEAERQKAGQIGAGRSFSQPTETASGSKKRFRQEIVRDLSRPGSTQKAFLTAQILGSPVGLKDLNGTDPLWKS